MNRSLALVFIFILSASSLLMVKPAFAQTIPTPTVPTFTLKYADHSYSYYVPENHSVDPYTGQNITNPSHTYYVENRTIDITIKNQSFVPSNSSTFSYSFFYNIRMKGHFAENWTVLYSPEDGFPTQSNSDYTVISYPVGSLPTNAQVDFQVEALIGGIGDTVIGTFTQWGFGGEESGWSNTQTINLADGSVSISTSPNPTLSPAPTSTPIVPEFPSTILIITFLIVTTLLVTVVIRRKRFSRRSDAC